MSVTWAAVLHEESAKIYRLDVENRDLILQCEISARSGADAEIKAQGMMRDLARYLDFQATHDGFSQFLLVSEPKRAGKLAAALNMATCRRYIGSVMVKNSGSSNHAIFEEIARMHGERLGIPETT